MLEVHTNLFVVLGSYLNFPPLPSSSLYRIDFTLSLMLTLYKYKALDLSKHLQAPDLLNKPPLMELWGDLRLSAWWAPKKRGMLKYAQGTGRKHKLSSFLLERKQDVKNNLNPFELISILSLFVQFWEVQACCVESRKETARLGPDHVVFVCLGCALLT